MTELKVTSLEEIKKRSEPIIELPGWDDGEPLFVKVKSSVSLTGLVKNGVIPNTLIPMIQQFVLGETDKDGKEEKVDKTKESEQVFELIEIICQQTILEPQYEEIKEHLTDKQKLAVFFYAQGGLRALESFRGGPRPAATSGDNSKGVQPKAK